MAGRLASHGQSMPRILSGTVVTVDPVAYTAKVLPAMGGGIVHDVVLLASQIDPLTGRGSYVVPTVGSQVIYAHTSEPNSRPVILGAYAPITANGTGTRKAGRPSSAPGNLHQSAGSAFLTLHQYGAVDLGAAPACALRMDARSQTTELRTLQLDLHTPGLSLQSDVLPEGMDAEGRTALRTSVAVWRMVEDPSPILQNEMGVLDSDSEWLSCTLSTPEGDLMHRALYGSDANLRVYTNGLSIYPLPESEAAAAGVVPEAVLVSGALLTDPQTALVEIKAALATLAPSLPGVDGLLAGLSAALAGSPASRYASKTLRA